MKIVAISDTHHKHYYMRLPKADMLIHAGDFSYRGTPIERKLVIDWLNHISKKYKYVVFIVGNHDIEMGPHTMSVHLKKNIIQLHDSHVEIEGVNFYGSAYTPRFGDWGFGETEDKLVKRFSHIKGSTDILITHGPPRSILDTNVRGEMCGSTALYNRIKALKHLKYHIFGHIHEGHGVTEIEGVKFCNVSILDEHYEIKNKPFIFETETGIGENFNNFSERC